MGGSLGVRVVTWVLGVINDFEYMWLATLFPKHSPGKEEVLKPRSIVLFASYTDRLVVSIARRAAREKE